MPLRRVIPYNGTAIIMPIMHERFKQWADIALPVESDRFFLNAAALRLPAAAREPHGYANSPIILIRRFT